MTQVKEYIQVKLLYSEKEINEFLQTICANDVASIIETDSHCAIYYYVRGENK